MATAVAKLYVPWGETLTTTYMYIHKALAKIHNGFWAFGRELVYCHAAAQEANAAAIFSNWR
jgi:hypothetical protein